MDDDEIIRLIATRCPELSDDIDQIAAALAGRSVVMLDSETAERLIDAIDKLEARVDQTVNDALAYKDAADAAEAFIDSASVTTWQ